MLNHSGNRGLIFSCFFAYVAPEVLLGTHELPSEAPIWEISPGRDT